MKQYLTIALLLALTAFGAWNVPWKANTANPFENSVARANQDIDHDEESGEPAKSKPADRTSADETVADQDNVS